MRRVLSLCTVFWVMAASTALAQDPKDMPFVDGEEFEYSLKGQELPQYTIVDSFYRRVIQVATVGLKRPGSWVVFLEKVGLEKGSAHEAALLEAAWKAQDLFERPIWNPALEGLESEEHQLARTREQARELAGIHRQLLNALESENQGDSVHHLEEYCDTEVRQGARLMSTDSGELSQYLEAIEEFDREMRRGGVE